MIKHLNKNNLHHAYLIEGDRAKVLPEIFSFIESLGVETSGNPDFYNISVDSFKIEDARNLKSIQNEKSFSVGKKIFLISANNFLLEAQNTLLKIFEEPTPDTHFFVIIPDSNRLLKTLVSRFYLIKTKSETDLKEAEKFISMPYRVRIDFLKELLLEEENARMRASTFLNALEDVMHQKLIINKYKGENVNFFNQIFITRESLNQPGSSIKNLMESVALNTPVI
jgi:hypothetical protein